MIQCKKDELIACSINSTSNNNLKKTGLIEGHAYSILHLIEINSPESDNYHKSHRLICLRNPQGDTEWNGSWSEVEALKIGSQSKLKKNL